MFLCKQFLSGKLPNNKLTKLLDLEEYVCILNFSAFPLLYPPHF